ncbi:Sodium- and chloride-dependent glycine transporter 1 [Lamellibrachia satsuma]|nr:Sodium- and chloride-dependent glycine transporter 1 [Lamellibrachia satsuma]
MRIVPSGTDVSKIDAEEGAVEEPAKREAWGGKLEFILTCVGTAVGLGNVWRFPYLCYRNGGGAFLIPYFVMLLLVGVPLFFLELSFGQFASLGPIAIWNVNPLMKGLGYAMVVSNMMVALYYNVIITWSVYYFFASMTSSLPWEFCGNSWNTDRCLRTGQAINVTANASTQVQTKTPSEEYFYNEVLNMSDGIDDMGGLRWKLALCLLLCWIIVFLVLIKGISSLGKVVYFSSIFPYVLLTVMFIRGVTLEGAATGIKYYLTPDFSKLQDAKVWSEAATQIFYSLSTCCGGLIAMSSYNQFNNNCLRDSILVPIINCATSFFAGFVIFSVLGFMAGQKGVDVADVATSGPGLVFVVYPEGLTQMPIAPLWSVLFFFMLMTLGFSSQFSMVECFFSSCIDEFPGIFRKNKRRLLLFRGGMCVVFYFVTLSFVTDGGFYLLNLIDVSLGGFPLLIIGFFETVAIVYMYGYERFAEDISMMLGKRPNVYFRFCWCIAVPVLLLGITIFMAVQYKPLTLDAYVYPDWAISLGWAVAGIPIACIPAGMLVTSCIRGGWQSLKRASRPSPEWGPANLKDRHGRYSSEDTKAEVPEVSESKD